MSSWSFLKFPFTSVTVGSGDNYAKNDQICKTVTIVTVGSRNNNGQSSLYLENICNPHGLFYSKKNDKTHQTWIVLTKVCSYFLSILFQDMKFRSAIMNDLKMVVTKYRQRPDHQEAGEADPLERWELNFLFVGKSFFLYVPCS